MGKIDEKVKKVILPGAGLILKRDKNGPYHLPSNMFLHMKRSEVELTSKIREISHPPTIKGRDSGWNSKGC